MGIAHLPDYYRRFGLLDHSHRRTLIARYEVIEPRSRLIRNDATASILKIACGTCLRLFNRSTDWSGPLALLYRTRSPCDFPRLFMPHLRTKG